MSCCQSQNREHKCDGAGGYGEDHNAVVRKKHGVHHAPPYLCLERRDRSLNALAVICDLGSSSAFSYMGQIRQLVMCSSWQTWNQKIVASLEQPWLGSRFPTQNCGRKGLVALSEERL
jgi:hypothetical protein